MSDSLNYNEMLRRATQAAHQREAVSTDETAERQALQYLLERGQTSYDALRPLSEEATHQVCRFISGGGHLGLTKRREKVPLSLGKSDVALQLTKEVEIAGDSESMPMRLRVAMDLTRDWDQVYKHPSSPVAYALESWQAKRQYRSFNESQIADRQAKIARLAARDFADYQLHVAFLPLQQDEIVYEVDTPVLPMELVMPPYLSELEAFQARFDQTRQNDPVMIATAVENEVNDFAGMLRLSTELLSNF